MSYELIVVGCSWGGLEALRELLADLPATLGAACVIVQHRGTDSPDGTLARLLAVDSTLAVVEAEDKDELVPGRVYLAPPDYHLLVEPGRLTLSIDGRENHSRPSIDILFESAAEAYGSRAVGVVLTGANADGARGLRRIRTHGGLGLAQNPATARRAEMPAAAIAGGGAHKVLELAEVGPLLADLCGHEPALGATG